MEQNNQNIQNPLAGMSKQKLYALIGAGAGLVALLLPWRTWMGYTVTNGFNGISIISLLGVVGVCVATFMGNKSANFEGQMKLIALGSFGAIALGALLTLLTKFHGAKTNAGFGVWLAIAIGVLGALFVMGIVKIPDNKPKA